QLGLALLVARNRTARWPLVLAVVLQASFVLAYLAAVTVGLPVDAAPHADEIAAAGHGALGHTETVTPLGVLTLGLELVGAAAGVGLIAPRRSTSRRAPGVDGTATRGL
ncbi:MAG TPA: hypothetical protein VFY23_15800, partial [Candidatus Limnocylindrales bacterium]|nr:hypothetical protein [Candidatus Limnocylindrales bacterium]